MNISSAILQIRQRVIVEPRARASARVVLSVAVVSLLGAGAVGGVFLAFTGYSPWSVYGTMIQAGFGTSQNLSETLVSATPLILTGCAAAIAFRMSIWNIGGEGQLYLGAIASAGAAIVLGNQIPAAAVIIVSLLAAGAGGAAWAAIAAIPRAVLGTNEIITTLMLNFVALNLMNLLIFGSASLWRDPNSRAIPSGRPIPEAAQLPVFWGRLHIGLFIAAAVAVALWWALRSTLWGFELRIVGDSTETARYAGISVRRKVLVVLCLSGAIAGLAGGIQVSGIIHSMDPAALSINLGFTGIIVAALAQLDPLGIVLTAFLIGALLNSGSALQTTSVPIAIVSILQGVLLLLVIAGGFLLRYRVRLASTSDPLVLDDDE